MKFDPHLFCGLETQFPIFLGHNYHVEPGYFQLDVPGVARYRVEEGRRILIQPHSSVSSEKMRLFLFGSTIGALLYQRGLLPIHGSAVVTEWGAMVFVGPQGSGKSTLAAEFHRRGYRILSDDLCAVDLTPKGLQILPALAQLRLRADSYQQLRASQDAFFDVDKFAVPMAEKYFPSPVPLRAIHILSNEDIESPHFEVVCGLDRVRRVFENLYRPHFLNGQRTQTDLIRLAGVIAQRTPIAVVSRKRDFTPTTDVVNFLESTWAARFTTKFSPGEQLHA